MIADWDPKKRFGASVGVSIKGFSMFQVFPIHFAFVRNLSVYIHHCLALFEPTWSVGI